MSEQRRDDGQRPDETQRMAELHSYQILDTDPEPAFDTLAQAAAVIAKVPTVMVTLIDEDRQWFKARIGKLETEGDRESAFCDRVVQSGDELIVTDASADPRFVDNPLVTVEDGIRFYAGFPLQTPTGAVLGTLCVVDTEPRDLSGEQYGLLRTLAEQVMTQLQLRRELLEREHQLRERDRLLARLEESQARYRSLVEHSFDVIARHRPDGSVEYVSPALRQVLGLDPETARQSQLLAERVHPDDLPGFAAAMIAAGRGVEGVVTGRLQHADGSWRHLETTLQPILDGEGTVREILSTGRDVTAAVLGVEALRRANDEVVERGLRLEEAQRMAGVGSFPYDAATRAITWSRELKRIFGQPDSFQPTFDSYRELLHPDDREVLTGSIAEAMRNGSFYEVEHRLTRADGVERILLARGRVELDADGAPFRLTGTGQDVTEARRTAEQLRRTGDLVTQVLAATQQSIIATDRDGVITVFNRGAERMLGHTAQEMVGHAHVELFHDPEEILARARELGVEPGIAVFTQPVEVTGEPETRQWTYVSKDGSRRQVQLTVTAMRGPDGDLTGYIGVASDITAQQRMERDRDAHAMMLRAVIENNQSVIYVKDLQGRYVMVNRAFEESFGVREADILGIDAFSDNPMAAEWEANNLRALDGPYRVEEFADLPDGRHWYDAVKVPLQDAGGKIYAICGLSLDITERRRAEADIKQAVEAMALARDAAIAATKAKSAFLATMSHEIRTPMNAVIGMTGLLLDTALDAEQRDLLETVRGSGDQLLSIINDILDFSKIESGDLELEEQPFELRECVEGTIAQFAGAAARLDLVSHLDDDCPPMVIGDVTRLRQVLANLVGNAVKFTEQGDILLRVELEPTGSDAGAGAGAGAEAAADAGTDDRIRLRFTVADTGIGISASNMNRLFKSFSQVDASTTRVYGGTGLGLAISKAIVEAMDGELTVTSTPGVGSEFTFDVALGRFDGPQGLRDRPASSLGGHRVLIVDDNDTNRRILRLQLEGYGMSCTDSDSPLDALALISGGTRFDAAILDFAMPVMDGVQLATALRQLPTGRDLPLVLLSSIGRRDRSDEALFATVLTKPTRSANLIEALSGVLSLAAATGHAADGSPQPVIPRPSRPAEPESESGRLRILLAEDNEVNQKVGRLLLGRLGHHVDIAENGSQALDAVHRVGYDVVLMDMHMPVMDGLEATRRIRAELPPDRQPHIIAMTASVTTEDRIACTEAGMDGYLPKPVRAPDLAAALAGVPLHHA